MPPQRIYHLSLLALILFLWLTALLSAQSAGAQAEPLSTSLESGAGTEPTPVPPASEHSPGEAASKLPDTPLAAQDRDWRLVGTAVADDPHFVPFAVIEHQPSRTQRAYHEGSHLGDHLIKRILDGAVVVGTRTGDALLPMTERRAAAAFPSGQVTHVPHGEVDATLPDVMHMMREIRVRPHFEGGKTGGFVIYNIAPDSIFARMGLQDGDVIESMNGKSFATTQPNVEFYRTLKEGGTVSLGVKRGDSMQRLVIEIQ